ncbi:MAG: WecB/TagA/CpsF family glycosyltransferase [Pontiella sp.]
MLDLNSLLGFVSESVTAPINSPAIMASGNVHSFNMAQKLPWYKEFLNHADIIRLDGAGVAWAVRILGYKPPQRSTWADFGWPLLEMCAEKGFKVFFFGCAPGIAEQARKECVTRYNTLQIVGTEHGFINWGDPVSEDNRQLIERINSSKADILIIGLGMPRQEQWILDHRDDLQVKIIMTGGAVFNYLAGTEKRAPQWMLNSGLEWFFRFLLEPHRLWKRYILGNPLFIIRVVKEVFVRRVFNRKAGR